MLRVLVLANSRSRVGTAPPAYAHSRFSLPVVATSTSTVFSLMVYRVPEAGVYAPRVSSSANRVWL